MKSMKKDTAGFTLLELIVVCMIVLTLGAATITQGINTQRSLSYKNAVNQTVQFIQSARSFALTKTADTTVQYAVLFTKNASQTIVQLVDDTNRLQETALTIPGHVTLSVSGDSVCNNSARISFAGGTAETSLQCDANTVDKLTVTLNFAGLSQTKTIVIHKISGIPQVVN